jgi:hypothetical protein
MERCVPSAFLGVLCCVKRSGMGSSDAVLVECILLGLGI